MANQKSTHDLVLEVKDLSVEFGLRTHTIKAVQNVSFDLRRGETLCVVGESGSGKSVTGRALLQITRPGKITNGSITFHGGDAPIDICQIPENDEAIRSLRGNRIAMIFQEPLSSLSPVHTIGQQIIESITLHTGATQEEGRKQAIELLRQVQIPDPENAIDKYTFQYSGGMRQRAMIAMALSCKPDVLIADEPTTALDVTTQAEILKLIKSLQEQMNMAVLFITHDTGVVAEIADRVAVMLRGELIEMGDVKQIFHTPKHAYTKHLIEASTKFDIVGDQSVRPDGLLQADDHKTLLKAENINVTFRTSSGFFGRKKKPDVHALKNVSFELKEGENLGIVGESGSGKTTLVRALVGLQPIDSGTAYYQKGDREPVNLLEKGGLKRHKLNTDIRMIFQDPFSSLNPRMTVLQAIAEPLLVNGGYSKTEIRDRVADLLVRVGLSADIMSRYPHAFSGGQRQRICIARALAVEPKLVIADEATSALDGSIRSQILDLMFELQTEFGLSFLFIGHDLGVVRYFCDRIAVMHQGEIVEMGAADRVCQTPREDYTQRLISAVPGTDPGNRKLMPAL